MSTVRVRALRPFRACGDTFAAGAVVALPPLDAAACIASGRATLVDDTDAAIIRDAVQADTARALKACGPVPRVEPGSPWRR